MISHSDRKIARKMNPILCHPSNHKLPVWTAKFGGNLEVSDGA
jgi:hypothetical protein